MNGRNSVTRAEFECAKALVSNHGIDTVTGQWTCADCAECYPCWNAEELAHVIALGSAGQFSDRPDNS